MTVAAKSTKRQWTTAKPGALEKGYMRVDALFDAASNPKSRLFIRVLKGQARLKGKKYVATAYMTPTVALELPITKEFAAELESTHKVGLMIEMDVARLGDALEDAKPGDAVRANVSKSGHLYFNGLTLDEATALGVVVETASAEEVADEAAE